jgi:hypothetical protein
MAYDEVRGLGSQVCLWERINRRSFACFGRVATASAGHVA